MIKDIALSAVCATKPRVTAGPERAGKCLTPLASGYQRVQRRFGSSPLRYLTIGRDPRFVWYRNAKVGTRTIYAALVGSDVRFVAEHAADVRVPRALLEDHFAFAFVRDPRTRLVSAWRNKVVDSNGFRLPNALYAEMQDFGTFVEWVSRQDLTRCDKHFRLQTTIVDVERTDFVGRFETFGADFTTVCNRLGITPPSEHRNASSSALDPWTPELLARVERLYRSDLQVFGY